MALRYKTNSQCFRRSRVRGRTGEHCFITPRNNEAKNTNCNFQLTGNRTDLYVLAHELTSEVDDLTNLRKHCISGDVSHLDDLMNDLIKYVIAQCQLVNLMIIYIQGFAFSANRMQSFFKAG